MSARAAAAPLLAAVLVPAAVPAQARILELGCVMTAEATRDGASTGVRSAEWILTLDTAVRSVAVLGAQAMDPAGVLVRHGEVSSWTTEQIRFCLARRGCGAAVSDATGWTSVTLAGFDRRSGRLALSVVRGNGASVETWRYSGACAPISVPRSQQKVVTIGSRDES